MSRKNGSTLGGNGRHGKREKTVLLTGAAGFMGSNFLHFLLRKRPHYRIIVLDCLTYAGNMDNLPAVDIEGEWSDRLCFRYGNVRNSQLVNTLVSQSDMVVHFASETHVTRSIYDDFDFFETDVLGTQVVANAVMKHRSRIERFVHISTSEVYGTALTDAMSEDHPLNPLTPYAAAKAGADRLVYAYWASYGIPAVIIRPFNTYGPRQHLEKAIPRFITAAMMDEPLIIHGDGLNRRDWIHVEDVARGLLCALEAPEDKVVGKPINLGSGRDLDVMTIAQRILQAFGKSTTRMLRKVPERPGQVSRHTADIHRAKELLHWEPRISFEEGLERTIAWYRENRKWWQNRWWMRAVPVVLAGGQTEYR